MKKRVSHHNPAPVPKPEEILSEEDLERIEADPAFRRMMKESEEDIRAGRIITHEEAMNRLHAGRVRTR